MGQTHDNMDEDSREGEGKCWGVVWCAAQQLTKLVGCRVYRPYLPL